MLETLENCRIGRIRASIHVKNFPLSAFKVTQRVPIIEIVCEANCDNLTLVRPSFVLRPRNATSIFFSADIDVVLFPCTEIDNDYYNRYGIRSTRSRRERERERGERRAGNIFKVGREGGLYTARRSPR